MGWASTKNGELLKLAAAESFIALLSVDKNMECQQSSKELAITVIELSPTRNRLVDLKPPAAIEKHYCKKKNVRDVSFTKAAF